MFETNQELHLHLYGCLTAEQVWHLGRDRWQHQTTRLDWYQQEYTRIVGRRPAYEKYWQDDDGLNLLKDDYLCLRSMSFAEFQVRFNLLIALFPLVPDDTTVLDAICTAQRQEGLSYAEYRLLLPLTMSLADLDKFMTTMSRSILEHSDRQFTARLIWTLPRDHQTLQQQYQKLRDWLAAHQELATATVGIDFCMDEEDDSPLVKKTFFDQVKQDNQHYHSLGIFFHVGETFARTALDIAARKVWEAAVCGVDRIGHGVALGVSPELLRQQVLTQTRQSRIEQLRWLLDHPQWHTSLETNEADLQKQLARLFQDSTPLVKVSYDDNFIFETTRLQNVLMADLATRPHMIECCPTSNLRLSQLKTFSDHPLPRFVDHHLNLCISSDDPGIFDTNLKKEVLTAQKFVESPRPAAPNGI